MKIMKIMKIMKLMKAFYDKYIIAAGTIYKENVMEMGDYVWKYWYSVGECIMEVGNFGSSPFDK